MDGSNVSVPDEKVGYIDILNGAAGNWTEMAVLVTRHHYCRRHVPSLVKLLHCPERANIDRMKRLQRVEISIPLCDLEEFSEGFAAILRNKNFEICTRTGNTIKKLVLPDADTFAVMVVLLWLEGEEDPIRKWETQYSMLPYYDRQSIADASKITTFIEMYLFSNVHLRKRAWRLIPYDDGTVTADDGHRMPGNGPWLRLLSSALVVERTMRLVHDIDCPMLPTFAKRYVMKCIPNTQKEFLPFPGPVKDKLDEIWLEAMARIKTALASVSNSISQKSRREGVGHEKCNAMIRESFESCVGMSGCFDTDLLSVNDNATLSEALEALLDIRTAGACQRPSDCASQCLLYRQHLFDLRHTRFVWRNGPADNGALGERTPVLLPGPPPLEEV